MQAKPSTKTRTRRLTDPDAMAAVTARGKYREHLPHFQKDGEGRTTRHRNVLGLLCGGVAEIRLRT